MWFLDGTIQKILRKMKLERSGIKSKQKIEEDLLLRKGKLEDLWSNHGLSDAEYKRRVKSIDKKLASLFSK